MVIPIEQISLCVGRLYSTTGAGCGPIHGRGRGSDHIKVAYPVTTLTRCRESTCIAGKLSDLAYSCSVLRLGVEFVKGGDRSRHLVKSAVEEQVVGCW